MIYFLFRGRNIHNIKFVCIIILDDFVADLADVEHRYQAHNQWLDRRQHVYSARTYFYEGEDTCNENMEVFLKCIDTTGNTAVNGFAAIKVTALGRPDLLVS